MPLTASAMSLSVKIAELTGTPLGGSWFKKLFLHEEDTSTSTATVEYR
jgi:hypothetical protein